LGLEPTELQQGLMSEITYIAKRYSGRCDRSKIPCHSLWVAKDQADISMSGLKTA